VDIFVSPKIAPRFSFALRHACLSQKLSHVRDARHYLREGVAKELMRIGIQKLLLPR
jgi:hypothetical protein